MMRISSYYLILVILLSLNYSKAQVVDVSSALKLNNKVPSFRILGKLDDKYLVERFGNDIHVLDVYNQYLKLQSSKQIQLDKNEKLEKIWVQPNHAWIILLRHGKEQTYIEANKMDAKLSLAQKTIVLDSIQERKDLLDNNFRTQLSSDESKILLYSPIFSQGKIAYFYTKVYDNNLKLINQQKLNTSVLLEQSFVDVFLRNDGSYLFITKSKEKSSTEVYYFTYVDASGKVSLGSFIPVKDIFKRLQFEIDEMHNSLLISGYFQAEDYSKKNTMGASQFFLSKLELGSFNNLFTSIHNISSDFYFELTGKKNEIDPPQLFTFYIKSIVPKIDGGALVIAESYFKNEEQFISNSYFSVNGIMPSYNTTTVYNFNDLIVYHVDSTGKVVNEQIVRKKQVSQNDGGTYSSFFLMNQRDELKLLFLDEIGDDSQINQASVDGVNSNTKSYSVFNTRSKNVVPIVSLAYQTAPNELIIPSHFKSRMQLIKIRY
ncbi:MAG: hypothetical protein H6579_03090 [Chitinophagales bacterium]|nr:hypothetical protein [Chitinophagales bacterium]